jgi:hypothetical protein
MMFIYVYYEIFACINLVDVMPLFSTVFFLLMTDFLENSPGFCQNSSGTVRPIFGKSRRVIGEFGR